MTKKTDWKPTIKEALKSVKIGTKDEAFWIDVQKRSDIEIEGLEKALKLQKAIRDMCALKIKEEQRSV